MWVRVPLKTPIPKPSLPLHRAADPWMKNRVAIPPTCAGRGFSDVITPLLTGSPARGSTEKKSRLSLLPQIPPPVFTSAILPLPLPLFLSPSRGRYRFDVELEEYPIHDPRRARATPPSYAFVRIYSLIAWRNYEVCVGNEKS